jgi:hypothetical protein
MIRCPVPPGSVVTSCSIRIHGTGVPVEKPSTASTTEVTASISREIKTPRRQRAPDTHQCDAVGSRVA